MLKCLQASKPKQYEYFFHEIITGLSKAVMKYKNMIIMSDFKINIGLWQTGYFLRPFQPNKLNSLRNMFNEKS